MSLLLHIRSARGLPSRASGPGWVVSASLAAEVPSLGHEGSVKTTPSPAGDWNEALKLRLSADDGTPVNDLRLWIALESSDGKSEGGCVVALADLQPWENYSLYVGVGGGVRLLFSVLKEGSPAATAVETAATGTPLPLRLADVRSLTLAAPRLRAEGASSGGGIRMFALLNCLPRAQVDRVVASGAGERRGSASSVLIPGDLSRAESMDASAAADGGYSRIRIVGNRNGAPNTTAADGGAAPAGQNDCARCSLAAAVINGQAVWDECFPLVVRGAADTSSLSLVILVRFYRLGAEGIQFFGHTVIELPPSGTPGVIRRNVAVAAAAGTPGLEGAIISADVAPRRAAESAAAAAATAASSGGGGSGRRQSGSGAGAVAAAAAAAAAASAGGRRASGSNGGVDRIQPVPPQHLQRPSGAGAGGAPVAATAALPARMVAERNEYEVQRQADEAAAAVAAAARLYRRAAVLEDQRDAALQELRSLRRAVDKRLKEADRIMREVGATGGCLTDAAAAAAAALAMGGGSSGGNGGFTGGPGGFTGGYTGGFSGNPSGFSGGSGGLSGASALQCVALKCAGLEEDNACLLRENELLRRVAEEAAPAARRLRSLEEEYRRLKKAQKVSQLYIYKTQGLQDRAKAYRETVEMQEMVILRLEEVLKLSGGNGSGAGNNSSRDGSGGSGNGSSSDMSAAARRASRRASGAARRDGGSSSEVSENDTKVAELGQLLEAKEAKIAVLHEQMVLDAQTAQREISKLKLRVFELEEVKFLAPEDDFGGTGG